MVLTARVFVELILSYVYTKQFLAFIARKSLCGQLSRSNQSDLLLDPCPGTKKLDVLITSTKFSSAMVRAFGGEGRKFGGGSVRRKPDLPHGVRCWSSRLPNTSEGWTPPEPNPKASHWLNTELETFYLTNISFFEPLQKPCYSLAFNYRVHAGPKANNCRLGPHTIDMLLTTANRTSTIHKIDMSFHHVKYREPLILSNGFQQSAVIVM